MKRIVKTLLSSCCLVAGLSGSASASSHMDAPLVTRDPAANTTDVYAFLTERDGAEYLTTALSVYPHEMPGVGPNVYNFDDDVLYQIHIALGDDVAAGNATLSYEFHFSTNYAADTTILPSYLGVIEDVGDSAQNLLQTYAVVCVDHRTGSRTVLGQDLMVPPNNQGVATPKYNVGDDGNMPAKDGAADTPSLDHYTAQTVHSLTSGYRAFAGQREDGFYGDIQGIFDLLSLRAANTESPGANRFDSQSGFNCHTLALEIPVSALGGNMQVVGVYATTSREKIRILSDGEMSPGPRHSRGFTQVGRQGNPLFCEALVAIKDKDLYNRTQPSSDAALFQQYALSVELEALIEALLGVDSKVPDAEESNRTDIASFFIPDLIKVDLSTGPCRLPGGNADDAGYSRLGLFGVDGLVSQVQTGFQALAAQLGLGDGVNLIPGGWPNGRRFGDDVIDIAVSAILSDLRDPVNATLDVSAGGSEPAEIVIIDGIDNVSGNDSVYNKVFPYAGTPHNGRNFQSNAGFTNTPTPPPAE